ncbi:alpha/beta fold hydrolase [Massilia glaciei]|uniref:Alpha/beta hydrolase n=1 Tax=Massilia glaciei TaxID=1524097 RepID=A0A2U2HG52_9BURK|nr:alpha/beta hydrolase [Massilia glaciei]PWF43687.1 alpha/beta hydrolase [Massilia glaciei]
MKTALLFALLVGAAAPTFAADAAPLDNPYAASVAPAERFDSGSLLVERHGERGRPLILVPGLASGAWAWQDLLRQLKAEHVIYVVTLAGFDGRAPVKGNGFASAQQSLHDLIVSRKLATPVLIGHSLGATLSLAIAQKHPALVGGVVAIDGLPVFPGTEELPVGQRAAMAEGMRSRIDAMPPDSFAPMQQQYMRGVGVIEMSKADELAKLTVKSDPGAVAQYMEEVLTLDLRPGLPAIKAPVLVIAPYFNTDTPDPGRTEAAKAAYYKSLMAGTPKLTVVSVSPSRHFVMFDQPQRVADAIRTYLKSL